MNFKKEAHAHILLFLTSEYKIPSCEHIDKIIYAEIPDKLRYPKLYEAVKDHMIHGPCGAHNKTSPCMIDGKCSRHFPKKFVDCTTIDDQGYPVYMRRDNGVTVEKNQTVIDNRFVVPYNPYLLLKFNSHINVEWCNQSRAIKYLFKYINKGYDRVTAKFYSSAEGDVIDEIDMYFDARYISAREAYWRILAFAINYQTPSVQRLSFHMPNEQLVLFADDNPIDSVVESNAHKKTMFMAWMEANNKYPEVKELTYTEFLSKFVWKQRLGKWEKRLRGFSIGRIFYVPPGSGEKYYCRILLNFAKGCTCFEDIWKVNGVQYHSPKDACYALGLLDDDKEYVDAINEASHWGSGNYLRKLFASLLFSNSMARPEHVWEQAWILLSEDLLHSQRRLLQKEGYMIFEKLLLESN